MDPMPDHPPVLLILNGEQAYALRDAITCLALASDGDLTAVKDTYAPQAGEFTASSNAYQQSIVKLAYEVHDQISEQQEPHIKAVGRWMRSLDLD